MFLQLLGQKNHSAYQYSDDTYMVWYQIQYLSNGIVIKVELSSTRLHKSNFLRHFHESAKGNKCMTRMLTDINCLV